MVKSKRLYLSHSLCSSESHPGNRPFGKRNILYATRLNDFMATGSNKNLQQMELGTLV